MLLAIDIGNSNISVGLFDRQRELRFLASLDTDSRKTADQISIDLMNLFTHGLWKPVTSRTRWSITWIFCAQVIPMNAPKWSVICLQMVGWTSSRKIAMGGTPREQEVCRA